MCVSFSWSQLFACVFKVKQVELPSVSVIKSNLEESRTERGKRVKPRVLV